MTVCYWCGAKDTLADVGKELDDGKYKMVQCSKCKNAYYVLNKEEMKNPKSMTNEEWLKTLNTEQLADVFYMVFHNHADRVLNAFWDKHKDVFKKDMMEWLKQPHTTIKE